MEEELKSAWEIALEKTSGIKTDADKEKLSPEQRKKISEIETEFQAQIAEKEIMFQTNVKKLAKEHSPADFQQQAILLQQNFEQEKTALQEEKARRIEAIKRGQA